MSLSEACDKAKEAIEIVVDDEGEKLKLTKSFVHLGSNIEFLIDDTNDIKNRAGKSTKEIGALKIV